MASTGEVYLGLYGDDFEPDDVSTFIDLPATRIVRRGERDADLPRPRHSAWKCSSGEIEGNVIDIYKMSDNLVARLAPYKSKIVQAMQEFDLFAVFQVVLWIDQDEAVPMPGIGFERPVLKFLAEIGATIDIDTYRK